jgi:hypothetical protein
MLVLSPTFLDRTRSDLASDKTFANVGVVTNIPVFSRIFRFSKHTTFGVFNKFLFFFENE